MRLRPVALLVALTVAVPRIALAAEPATTPAKAPKPGAEDDEDDEEPRRESDHGHARQFGLRVGVVGNYRMVLRYDQSPYCEEPAPTFDPSKDEKKFCGFMAKPAIDLALSFAPFDGIEPFLWARLGLGEEKQTDTKALRVIGVGARVYTMADSPIKIFIQPALGWELEGGRGTPAWATPLDPKLKPQWKRDLLFSLTAGPQFDFSKYVGLYAQAGLTVGVLRYLSGGLEFGAGLQGRVP